VLRSPRSAPAARGRLRCRGAAAAALSGCLALAGCAEPEVPPNLLLVTVDTLRADRLACYGGEADVGVAICALADGGTRFEWAIAAAPYTAPSVASILTSAYPAYHGVSQSALSYLRDTEVTLAEVLRAAGYQTAAFVSNPVIDRSRSLDQGFDVYDQRMRQRERNRPHYVERVGRDTTDAALAWAQVTARPPWFLWVHYQDPHGPYEPPGAAPGADDPTAARLPVNRTHSGHGGIPAYQALPGLFTAPAYERRYGEEIRYLDPHVRRLVEGLDALGDPPAVLLTSDHGEAFGEDDFWFAHGHSVGLDQIRVPLLWRPPRPRAPEVVTEPVSLLDVAPTLLRVAGLEAPEAFQGRPLPVPEAGGGKTGARRIFSEHVHRLAVIDGDRYYARDRRPVGAGERDRTSGGRFVALPRRSARLGGDGALPPYTPGEVPGLEAEIAGYLEATRSLRSARRSELPEGRREALRALGYLE
jgi:arylsulfatase A-like enzyme